MPRTLIAYLPLLVLVGCMGTQPVEVVDKTSPVEVVAFTSLQEWLDLQQQSAQLSSEEAQALLAELENSGAPSELFRAGLLNQQLKTFNGWILARDTFRELQQTDSLTEEQRQLANILEMYNQSRINWYEVYNKLLSSYTQQGKQLSAANDEKALLEEKIKALADIDSVISTRKEQ